MPKLPILKPKKVMAMLERNGFLHKHTTGSPYIYFHPVKRNAVTVPFHNRDLAKGTLLSIIKQAGLSKKDL